MNDSLLDIDAICRLYHIADVLRLDPSKRLHVCPFPDHHHQNNPPSPSLSIDIRHDGLERFHCFGSCGHNGSVIDAVGYVQIPGYNPKSKWDVARAIGLLTGSFQPSAEPIQLPERRVLNPLFMRELEPPGPQVRAYAERRGLTHATLVEFGCRQKNGALAMPAYVDSILWAVKYRATWDNPNARFWSEPGSQTALFNHDRVKWTNQPVLVVKGEIPVMLLHQYGLLACCPTTGETRGSMAEWQPVLAFSDRIVVVTDNDPNPSTREKILAKAKERAASLNAELKAPPQDFKDIDEWMLADPSAISVIRGWLDRL